MGHSCILTSAVLVIAQLGHAAPQANSENNTIKLDGTWELVTYKYGQTHGVRAMPNDRREIKLISGTHFVWVIYNLRGKKATSVGGGTYSLKADHYIEQLDFGGGLSNNLIGKAQSFKISIDGDKWQQSGVLSNGLIIEETWQRIQ
jgi:hypothetical protein